MSLMQVKFGDVKVDSDKLKVTAKIVCDLEKIKDHVTDKEYGREFWKEIRGAVKERLIAQIVQDHGNKFYDHVTENMPYEAILNGVKFNVMRSMIQDRGRP